MNNTMIKLYYKNVMRDVIGSEHGVSPQQFADLAQVTSPAILKVNDDRNDGLTPYRDLPYDQELLDRVNNIASQVKDECEIFVVLGIGGSALGNIALQTALNSYMYNLDDTRRKGPRFFVFDNVDPVQFGCFLDWVEPYLDKTIFNVISKSGRTAETAAQFLVVREMLLKKYGKEGLKKHIIATTDKNDGTLRKITSDAGFRDLIVPDGVGGRFSVLSDVGLLSAAVCGIDISELLAGARSMDDVVGNEDFYKNPAAINAALNWHYYNRGKKISVMMPYSHSLKDLSDWYRQLWAESLGKAKSLDGNDVFVGPTPVNALGTTDQHSQVQLYREGPNDKLFTFLQVENFAKDVTIGSAPEIAPELNYLDGAKMSKLLNSEKLATEYALIKSQRPNMTVIFDEISPYTIGQFIYFYEVTTSIAGTLFNINTYDQPAVELGKDATFALMGLKKYEDLARDIEPVIGIDQDYIV